MRNLLAFFAAVLLTVAVVGWYLDWFKIERAPASPGHNAVKVDIDSGKIEEDLYRGEKKIQDTLDRRLHDENSKRTESPKTDGTKTNPPR
jgi:hypothetical protein